MSGAIDGGACVYAHGSAGVLLIRFTSSYQEYKGNERPAWRAISELRRARCIAHAHSQGREKEERIAG